MERTELGLLTPPSTSGRETQNLLREGYAFRGPGPVRFRYNSPAVPTSWMQKLRQGKRYEVSQ